MIDVIHVAVVIFSVYIVVLVWYKYSIDKNKLW